MKLNLRSKLLLAFGSILALTVIVGWMGIVQSNKVTRQSEEIANEHLSNAIIFAEISQGVNGVHAKVLQHILYSDPVKKKKVEQEITDLEMRLDSLILAWRRNDAAGVDETLIRSFGEAWRDYKQVYTTLALDASRSGFKQQAIEHVNGEVAAQFHKVSVELDAAQKNIRSKADLQVEEIAELSQRVRREIAGVLLFAAFISLGLSLYVSNTISKGVRAMVNAAEQIAQEDLAHFAASMSAIAQGDLTCSITIRTQALDYRSSDEIGKLAEAFNQVIDRLQQAGISFADMLIDLRGLIDEVTESANSLSAASEQLAAAAHQAGAATAQIAASVQQVARGTARQTESITSTAAGIDQMSHAIDGVAQGAQKQASAVGKAAAITSEITTAIQQVAGNAQAGAKGAIEAAENARSGRLTVEETVHGMQTIREKVNDSAHKVQEMGQRSTKIGAILEVIDDLASQTNLLALNAAIEAARAGEHGKGFAVVADEVRKLAEKSAAATKEISSLIHSIQRTVAEAVAAMEVGTQEVENGVIRANRSGQALECILQAVEAANRQVDKIATAAQHIRASSDQLVTAVDAVSVVVEENTAATEEMAAGSNEVTQSIESIASVSQENSAAIEEVSANTEEMSAQVKEVTASAQSLAVMAQTLQQLVHRFKIKQSIEGSDRKENQQSIEDFQWSEINGISTGRF